MDTGVENCLIALILSLDEGAGGDHTVHLEYVFHLMAICKFNDFSYHHKPQWNGQASGQINNNKAISLSHLSQHELMGGDNHRDQLVCLRIVAKHRGHWFNVGT
eukprot:TRINITY_DN25506_c0_g1_i1.p1 TRINITY_DN25506_c0_g1~~TRINITY_DN25506_c0_g1_i1.p1  ORF type:complete len:104 (+),score=2.18 TRINITY_DN25506_c0_g1_i1:145-456(+)